jgi:hypothetical protein
MFENSKPISAASSARFSEKSGADGARESQALRALEWSELTARLSAARDLRLLLRRDAVRDNADGASSFADAAARYFRTRNDDEGCHEPGVNPVALERCKGSPGMVREQQETNWRLHNEEANEPDHATIGPIEFSGESPSSGPKTGPKTGNTRED